MKNIKYNKGSFVIIPNKHILRGKNPIIQTVYFWICEHADGNGECYPSRSRIAEESGCGVSSVDNAIKDLCDLGILNKINRMKGNEKISNLYQIMSVEDEGGSPPHGVGSPPHGVGVAHHVRIELNPYNSNHLTSETEVSQNNQSTNTKQSKLSFDEFMQDMGYEKYEYPSASENSDIVEAWGSSPSKKLSDGMITSLKREYNKKYGSVVPITPHQSPKNELQQLFYLFHDINPAWQSFRINKTQINASKELLEKYSLNEIEDLINRSKKLTGEFAPKITTPYDLLFKQDKIIYEENKIKREQKNNSPKTFADISGDIKL